MHLVVSSSLLLMWKGCVAISYVTEIKRAVKSYDKNINDFTENPEFRAINGGNNHQNLIHYRIFI